MVLFTQRACTGPGGTGLSLSAPKSVSLHHIQLSSLPEVTAFAVCLLCWVTSHPVLALVAMLYSQDCEGSFLVCHLPVFLRRNAKPSLQSP